jgi:hypothetical protein
VAANKQYGPTPTEANPAAAQAAVAVSTRRAQSLRRQLAGPAIRSCCLYLSICPSIHLYPLSVSISIYLSIYSSGCTRVDMQCRSGVCGPTAHMPCLDSPSFRLALSPSLRLLAPSLLPARKPSLALQTVRPGSKRGADEATGQEADSKHRKLSTPG